ncbi:MAG: permease prefix domain 1-containing protein [Pedobacter sp.]
MAPSNFDLKQAIDDYISLINQQGSITNSDKNELTNHLHDSTEAMIKQGLSEEESFIIACKRIGGVEVLTEEYSKVNTSLKGNKVWAYLLLGFNVFYGIPSIVATVITVLYFLIHKNFGSSIIAVSLVTIIHLMVIIGLWSLVKYKRHISGYIQNQVEQNPISLLMLSCLPIIVRILFTTPLYTLMPGMSIKYPLYMFNSGLIEFSYYLVYMSILSVFLSLVFSINQVGASTLRTLFTRPTVMSLLSFGFMVELLASCTRGLLIDNIVIESVLFGMVYMAASFLISYYNEAASVNRYLLFATALGLILEVSVGISADLGRGNTYFTAFFTAGLIAGVAAGRYLGIKLSPVVQVPDHI